MTDKHRLPIGALKLFDVGLLVISFAIATILIVHEQGTTLLGDFLSMRTKVVNFLIFGLLLLISHVILCICSPYQSRRLSNHYSEIADLVEASTVITLCFFFVGSIFSIRLITLQFSVAFWFINTALLCLSHLLLRLMLARFRLRGRNLRYMLILGTNDRALSFARKISASGQLGYRVIGFVDDKWARLEQFKSTRLPLVSNYAGLAEFLRQNVVDEVVNFLPFASFHRHFGEVAQICAQHGIIMRFNPEVFGLAHSQWRAEEFGGEYYIATCGSLDGSWPHVVKRVLDIAISLGLLALCAPILAAAAIAIKLSSPGPVFFLQERVGLNKRRFRVYKFRTMVPNAESLISSLASRNEASGPVFKIKKDPRITRIGSLLRRSSIDELPQLLNVLKGDMSLVGPRPLPVRDYEGFDKDWQRRRFSVKPGITCLWQVNGRSNIPFDKWMLLDMQYMDEWSLWLDMKILAKTIPAVMRGSGAA